MQEQYADALLSLNSVAVENEVFADFAKGVPSFTCPAIQVDRLEARID